MRIYFLNYEPRHRSISILQAPFVVFPGLSSTRNIVQNGAIWQCHMFKIYCACFLEDRGARQSVEGCENSRQSMEGCENYGPFLFLPCNMTLRYRGPQKWSLTLTTPRSTFRGFALHPNSRPPLCSFPDRLCRGLGLIARSPRRNA